MKDDQVYLRHILDAVEKIETYLDGQTYKSFSSNNMMIDAVVRELEIVGEATNHLSDLLRESHPEIPWRDAIDMRNILIPKLRLRSPTLQSLLRRSATKAGSFSDEVLPPVRPFPLCYFRKIFLQNTLADND